MSLTSNNEFSYQDVSKRIDFSGLFRSSSRSEQLNRFPETVLTTTSTTTTRRRRPREISPLQFEPDFEDMDLKEEM
jgi:hypothetical protein